MTIRILFVGNSFVSRHDVPGLVRELAESTGRQVQTASIVAGGASLRRHLNGGAVAKALEQSPWNHVVLQEQSTLPVKNRRRYHENVRALHTLIEPTGAQTVLYMTWARQWARDSQEVLTAAVEQIGKELGALVAPAGVAWQHVLDSHPEVDLYAADGSHPTPAGSLLAACVLYGTLFREPALDVAVPSSSRITRPVWDVLTEAARRALQ